MPVQPQKQSATTTPSNRTPTSKSNSLLDRITPVSKQVDSGMIVNFYGRNGSGKTTLSCTFPKPLLIVGLEDGTRSVRNVPGVDFLHVDSSADLIELTQLIRDDKTATVYKSIVVDTATSLQDMVLKEVLNLEELPVQLAWGTVTQNQYRQRSEKTKELLRPFLDIGRRTTKNVIILAQEKNHSAKDGEGSGDSEILVPFVGSSIGASVCGWLQDNCDFICQTYTRELVESKEVTIGTGTNAKKTIVSNKTGKVEFCLRTQRAHPVYAAKMRVDKNVELPDMLSSPTYEKLLTIINGKKG